MKLRYQHDFTGDSKYPLPYVLVFGGSLDELEDLNTWITSMCKGVWTSGLVVEVNHKSFSQSFHFADKRDMVICKLSH